MMTLTKDQELVFQKTMDETRKQLDSIDSQVEQEIQRVREKLAQIQESQKSFKIIYEEIAKLLGIVTDLEKETT